MLFYSICFYYDAEKNHNVEQHWRYFNELPMKDKKFIVNLCFDLPNPKAIEEYSILEEDNLIVLPLYNWGGTIAAFWNSYQYIKQNYPNENEEEIELAHFEEDFWVLDDSWYNQAHILLQNNQYIYVGESITGQVKQTKEKTWTDGGFYFSNLKKLKQIEEKIGIFHKGNQNTLYEHWEDGIKHGECGFPTLLYNSGFRFSCLLRGPYFIHTEEAISFCKLSNRHYFHINGRLTNSIQSLTNKLHHQKYIHRQQMEKYKHKRKPFQNHHIQNQNIILYYMGIRERLRRQRQLEREQQEQQKQQTVPEAVEEAVQDMMKQVETEYAVEIKLPKELPKEEPKEEVKKEIKEEPKEEVKKEIKEEPKEEVQQLSNGKYKISGIYKSGLELSFYDFIIKPTQSYLSYGDKRIKGANNPFMALLNQPYVLIVTVDSYLLTIQIGKTILKEKISLPIILDTNQPITIEKID